MKPNRVKFKNSKLAADIVAFNCRRRRAWLLKEWKANPLCDVCGKRCSRPRSSSPLTATVDHVHPRSRGGVDHPINFALLCRACNKAKDRRVPKAGLAGRRSRRWPDEVARLMHPQTRRKLTRTDRC